MCMECFFSKQKVRGLIPCDVHGMFLFKTESVGGGLIPCDAHEMFLFKTESKGSDSL